MDGYFIFLVKSCIMQINNDIYFILADPPILQEIAKHAQYQHYNICSPIFISLIPSTLIHFFYEMDVPQNFTPLSASHRKVLRKKVWSRPDTIYLLPPTV